MNLSSRREFLAQAFKGASALALTQLFSPELQAFYGADWAALKNGLKGKLFLPSMGALFTQAGQAYQARYQVPPQALVQVAHIQDIEKVRKFCKLNKIQLHLKAGGHSYEALSRGPGVVLDFRNFKQITWQAQRTLRVEAGALAGDVITFLGRYGYMLPLGSTFNVGITGLTLGGGYGYSSRPYGLACDQVVAFEGILADGSPFVASATQRADLYWALKGGGHGQLALVSAFHFRPIRSQNLVYVNLKWKANRWRDVLEAWQNFAPTAPSALTLIYSMAIYSSQVGVARTAGYFYGSESELRKLLNQNMPMNLVETEIIKPMSFNEASLQFNGRAPETLLFKNKSDYIYQKWDNAALDLFENQLKNQRLKTLIVMFDPYGGAIGKIPRTATAFPHRDALCSVQYICEWKDAKDTVGNLQEMNNLYLALRPIVSGECYVNYCDLDLPQPQTAYYAENLPRLKQVKAIYDSENFFRHAQSV